MKQTILIFFCLTLSYQLRISHDQFAYRLGSNYAGDFNTQTINNCDVSNSNQKPQQPIFEPVPINPITIVCTLPKVFNPTTKSCECISQTIFDPQTNQCLCPPQNPLWNGSQCVSCSQNMYFDPEQRQCYTCPEGFVHTLAYGNKSRCDQTQ